MPIIPPLPPISAEIERKIKVWSKATVIPGKNLNELRKDAYGNVIRYSDYGDTSSEYGWEIDHIVPKDKGGSDHIDNLQPLHWKSNREKAARLGFLAGLSGRKR